MKKIIFLFIAISFQLFALAQVPTQSTYPDAPLAATQINKYSFFIDSVSNVNEQPLAFASALNNTTVAAPINLAGVTTGLHQLYVKVTTTNGVSSITNISNFYMAGDNVYPNVPSGATPINSYSFFIDSVSNVNEQSLTFTAAATNTTIATPINLAGVTSGLHQLYAKVINTNSVQSITNIGNFYMDGNTFYANVTNTATAIDRYEFYIDSVTNTNIQSLSFSAGLQNTNPSASINLLNVLPGSHQLYAKVFSTNNTPSIVNLGQFLMDQNFRYADVPASAPSLQNMEYYIDTDPGYGLATAITISGTNTTEVLNNIGISIPNNLVAGTHFLHIRSRQNPWSIDNALPFEVGVVLPVTWLYVKVQLANSKTLVQWATSSQVNTKLYQIEWSTNGVTFKKIGSVDAIGNSNINNYYSFDHIDPTVGLNYYRIKQIDVDGRFKYSAVVKILSKENLSISVFPNPASELINVDFSSKEQTIILAVFDAQGKQVIQTTLANTIPLQVNIAALTKGIYYIQVSDGTQNGKLSFTKQ